MRTVAGRGVVVVAAPPLRVEANCPTPDAAERDLLRGRLRAGCDREERPHTGRVRDAPLEHLHATHRASDDAEPLLDPEMAGERGLHSHHVADRDHREARAVGTAGRRLDRRWARRPLAAAEHVGTHDEELLGVDREAGTDHALPPAGRDVARHDRTGDVAVARPRVADQDGVARRRRRASPRSRTRRRLRRASRRPRVRNDGRRAARRTAGGRQGHRAARRLMQAAGR